jgi:3-hydroxybutyrate dehydrogenase
MESPPTSLTAPMGAAAQWAPLLGKRALVTGAASGIGLAVAHHLLRLGAQVTFSDLDARRVAEATGGVDGAREIAADLADQAQVVRLARDAGPVDILVNNAGLQHVNPVESFEAERWNQLLSVMLTAPFLLIRALIPGMYERGWGRIVNVASVHGLVASPYKAAYVAAKHGLLGLTKTVALEAGARGGNVSVTAVCPSYVRTPLVEKQIADQARVRGIAEADVLENVLLERNAVKRLIEPDEVAQAVAFLCGEAAWSMTGAALTLDAGWLAH